MSIKRHLAIPIFLAIITLLTACSESAPQPLSVGSNQWPGYEPLHLAQKLGFHDGYPIKLFELTSATDVMNAFKYGQLDVAALTLDEVILLAEDMPDLVVFLVMDISNGADTLIAKPHITSLADLANQRIGVEETALGAFFFSQVLKAANLTRSDVTVVPTTVDQHLRMMESDNLDAVVTFEPTASTLVLQGNVSIFDSSQIPDTIVDVLVTTRPVLEAKYNTIQTLVSAHWDALDYLTHNPEEAAKLMAPRLHISSEQLLQSYEGLLLPNQRHNQRLLGGELDTTVTQHQSLMLKERIINQNSNLETLISDRLVKQ
jgi:NitT/TauT family transport system substrate-binding protein